MLWAFALSGPLKIKSTRKVRILKTGSIALSKEKKKFLKAPKGRKLTAIGNAHRMENNKV
jgi:hypothetical protein